MSRSLEQRLQELAAAYQLDCPELSTADAWQKALALYRELEYLRLEWRNSQRRFFSHVLLVDSDDWA